MPGSIADLNVSITGDASPLASALGKVESQLAKTASVAQSSGGALASALGKAGDTASQMGLRFDEAAGKWRTSAGRFASAAEMAAAGVQNAKKAVDGVKQSADGATSSGDRLGNVFSRIQQSASALAGSAGQLGGIFGHVQQAAQATAGAFAPIGVGAVAMGNLISSAVTSAVSGLTGAFAGLAQGMVAGNGEFERYGVQFGVLLRSSDAAKQRLEELAKFGATTPFNLPEVVQADKILQGFGLHSEESAKKFGFSGQQIRTVAGDVAAGSGAAFTEIANYLGKFASGATGEAIARFQELGIVTRAELTQMGVAFSKSGELVSPINTAMAAVLTAMQSKFGGMMAAQSATFEGMVSNLQDFAGQATRILGSGLFDAFKGELSGLLTALNTDQVSNALQSMGASIGGTVRAILEAFGPLSSQVPGIFSSVASAVQSASSTIQSALLAFRAGGVGAGAASLLQSMGLDPSTASQVGAIIRQIVSAVQSGINTIKAAVTGFQTGGVSGLLTGLGLDSSTVSTVTGVMNQIGGAIQGGINTIKAAVTGFQTGGVSGLLVGLGLDPAVAASVSALMDSIANAVMTGASIVGSAFTALAPYAPMLAGALSIVANIAGGVLVGALNILAGVINFVTQHWQLFASILTAVGAVLAGSAIIGAITTLMSVLGGLGAIVASAGGVMGTLTTIMGLVAGAIALPAVPIILIIGLVAGLAAAWATNLGGIQEKTAEVAARVGASFEQLGGVAGALGDALGRAAKGDFSGAWSGFQERVSEVNATYQAKLQEIDSGTSTTVANVKSSIQSGMSGLSDIVGNAFSGVTDTISSFMSKAVGDTAAKANQIRAILSSVQTAVGGQGGFGLDQGLISGSTDAGSIAQRNADFVKKGVELQKIATAVQGVGGAAGAASGAAKSAEDKIKEAADALNRVTDLVKSIGEMLKSGLDGLTVGDGADKVVQVAAQLAQVGRRIADAFAAASAGLKDDSYKAAQELSSGISASSQALSSVIGLLPKLWEFVNSSAWGEMQGSLGDLLGVAGQLAQWGRSLFDVFSAAAQGVSEEAAKASQILSQGISAAASGIGAVIGLLPKLWEFVNSPMFDAIMEAKSELISAAAKISQFGRALFEVFAEVAQGVSEDAVKAAQLLSQGITSATSAISATIDTVKKLIDFIYGFDTQMALTDEGRAIILSAAEKLSELGRDILDAFAQAAAGLSGKTVAAAQRLATGIEASMGALSQTADTVRKLINLFYDIDTRQIVAAESQGHLAVQHIAMRLIAIGRNALLNFAKAGEGIRGQTIVAAKVMADGISGAMSALSTVADSVRKLINLFYDIDTRQIVAAEANGHWAVQHIALRLITLGRESLLNFARAGEGIRAGTLGGAKAMADGIAGAMGALGQIADVIPKLINLFYDLDTRQIVAAESQGHLAVQHIALRLIAIGQFVVSEMGAAAQGLGYMVPSGVRVLSEAIGQAVDALSKLTDLIPRLVSTMQAMGQTGSAANSQMQAALQATVYQLIQFGTQIAVDFGAAAQQLGYFVPSGVRTLSEAILKSVEAVSKVADLVNLLTSGLSFNPDALDTEKLKTLAARLIDLGRDLANYMGSAAQSLTASTTSIKSLAEATNATVSALSEMMGFVDRLLVFVSDNLAYVIATGPNAREWVKSFAINLAQLAVEIVNGFGSVAGGLNGPASAAASTLATAINNVLGPMNGLMDFVDHFLTFIADSTAYALATGPNARILIANFATNLAQLSVEIVNSFGSVATSLDSVASAAARRLGEAIQNVLGPMVSLMDWLNRFNVFTADRLGMSSAMSDTTRTQVRTFADKMAELGKQIVLAFGAVGAGLSEMASIAADRLARSISVTVDALEKSLGLIDLLGQVLRAEPNIPYMGQGSPYVQALQNLVRFGSDVVKAANAALTSVQVIASGPLINLKDALDAVAGVFSGVFSAIDIILRGQIPGAVSFANLDAGETASPFQLKIMSLVGIAQGIADAASRAMSAVTVMANGPLSQLNETLGSALGVLQGAFDAIKLLASDAAIPADAGFANLTAGGTASPYQLRIMSLVTFAHGIADTAARALVGLETIKSGPLSDLASVIGDALGVLQGALDGIKLLAERVDIPDISPLTQAGQGLRRYITTLAQFGQQVTEVVRDAVVSFTIGKDPAITTLAGVVGDGITILSSALDGIKLLTERVQIPDISQLTVAGRDLRAYITALAQFGQSVTEVVRDAVVSFTIGKDPAISVLSGTVGDGMTILQTSLDLIKTLAERVTIPDISPFTQTGQGLRRYIRSLARFARDVTVEVRDAVTAFSIGENSGLSQLSGTVGDGMTILQSSLDLIKTLAERVTIPDISPFTQAGQGLRRYIRSLARFARDVTVEVRDAVTAFSIGENSGLGQLSGAVGDGMTILQTSLDLIKTLVNRVTIPNLDDIDFMRGSLRAYITRLAQFARDVTIEVRDAVTAFSVGENSGLSQLSGTVGDGMTILQSGLDLIKTITNRVTIPNLDDIDFMRGSLRAYIARLAQFARDVTVEVRDAVTAFSIVENSGLGQLSGAVGDGMSILQGGLDLIKTTTNRVTIPNLDDVDVMRGSLRAYINRLAQFARDVTVEVRDAVAAFSIGENSGLSQLAPTVGDALSVLTDGLDLTGLIDKILNFRGVNWQTVGPKLDLLLKDIIEIARRFATAAANANIPEAFADAGSQVASLFGDAAGALNDAIELGVKLLDPETVVPSISQVDSKLNGLLTLITEVVNRFADKAASIGGDKITAAGGFGDAISSVFEGISKVAQAIQDFQGIRITEAGQEEGTSGLNNIRESLRLLFDTFDEFAGKADSVNAVSAAIASLLGGLTNLASAEGLSAGKSWGQAFVDGLRSVDIAGAVRGATQGPSGNSGGATPGPAPVGNSGSTTVNNINQTFSTTTINVSMTARESAIAQGANSIMGLKALYGAGL